MNKVLTAQTLQDLDKGKVALAINQAIRQATTDIIDRPGDATKRKVLVQINLAPMYDEEQGVLDEITAGFIVKVNLPPKKTKDYPMIPTREGTMLFQPDAPENPRQYTMGQMEPEKVDPETGEVTGG